MNYSSVTRLLIMTFLLAGCANSTSIAAPTQTPQAVHNASTSGAVTASANVVPVQVSQVGFLLSASVKEVDIKEGEKIAAGQTLIVLDTPDLSLAVVAAQATVRSAQADVERLNYPYTKLYRGGQIVYVKENIERRQEAQAQLEAAQATLESARAALAQATLVAPYDSTVVKVNVVPGQLVQAGQIAAVIGELGHLQIETTDLSEREIATVKLGQSATVRVNALNQDFSGKVIAIAPRATKHNSDWVYQVTVQLDQQPQGLMWGMSAEVNIQSQ
jgi:RND family efflux transporter MFP subunit